MSRKGKVPVSLPKGVEAKFQEGSISIKGPKGTLVREILPGISVQVDGESVTVQPKEGGEDQAQFWGLTRTLIENMVLGTSQGFTKKLEMKGVGYRAQVQGRQLQLQVGKSHPVALDIPEGINVEIEKNVGITITGIDNQKVGQFASDVRSTRPPEPYQGKGIRYVDEYVRRKAGKSAAKK
ncbi:MAG: 50S ribosomal protein L6 [Chlamydiia bacterium]|nr:50S ribosomal protein L6 [Chlamydiia bacterium]